MLTPSAKDITLATVMVEPSYSFFGVRPNMIFQEDEIFIRFDDPQTAAHAKENLKTYFRNGAGAEGKIHIDITPVLASAAIEYYSEYLMLGVGAVLALYSLKRLFR